MSITLKTLARKQGISNSQLKRELGRAGIPVEPRAFIADGRGYRVLRTLVGRKPKPPFYRKKKEIPYSYDCYSTTPIQK